MPFVEIRAALSGDMLMPAFPLPMVNIEAFKLAVHLTVAKATGAPERWITCTWQKMSDESLVCSYIIIMPSIDTSQNSDQDISCASCDGPCEDADDWPGDGRERNCIRCRPCYLCADCRVYISKHPVCMLCLEEEDISSLTPPQRSRFDRLSQWWDAIDAGDDF